MARKRNYTKRDWRNISVTGEFAVTNLAVAAAIVEALTASDTPDNEFKVTSIDLTVSVTQLTSGEGPVVVGLANDDYSTTEIAEFIAASSGFQRGDMIEKEQLSRRIRLLGAVSAGASHGVIGDGTMKKTKLNWNLAEGHTVNIFAFNGGDATLTTGANCQYAGTIHGYWL